MQERAKGVSHSNPPFVGSDGRPARRGAGALVRWPGRLDVARFSLSTCPAGPRGRIPEKDCAMNYAALLIGVLGFTAANAVALHESTVHGLTIDHPYARATPPGARVGGAYLIVQNAGAKSD